MQPEDARAVIDVQAMQAKRLKALWRIVTAPNIAGEDLIVAMLSEGAEAMRPGRVFAGTLGHIEGDDYVLDVVSTQLGDGFARRLLPSRVKRSDTLHVRELAAARTQSWDECRGLPGLPEAARLAGLRSQITTQFTANGRRYVLTFGSLEEPSALPFGIEDNEYVEVLASILARHLEREAHLTSLRDATRRSRYHAERLARFVKFTNDGERGDERDIVAALGHAAGAIRPGQTFHGAVCRVEDGARIVLASATSSGDAAFDVGSSMPNDLFADGVARTLAHDDVRVGSASNSEREHDWRAVIATTFDAGASKYMLVFVSSAPVTTSFAAEDRAYMDVLVLYFANVLKLGNLQSTLDDDVELTYRQTVRLAALKATATDPRLSDKALLLALLTQSAAVIRRGQSYRAILWRVDGPNAIAEVIASPEAFAGDPYVIGSSVPLERTALQFVVAKESTTRSWDDMQASDEMDTIARRYTTRALIVSSFRTDSAMWMITFASDEPARFPFGPQDHAYVEVLGSLIASHLDGTPRGHHAVD